MSGHVGELALRRFRAGELQSTEAHECEEHLGNCPSCRSRLKTVEQEQRRFEQEIPFERFAAGVQRAMKPRAPPQGWRWTYPALGLAAAALIAVVVFPEMMGPGRPGTRIKGSAEVVLRTGGRPGEPQRTVGSEGAEALLPEERIRIGFQPGGHRYVAAISIDDQGSVTALYPDSGTSIAVSEGDQTQYLPDSIEFTGTGLERVIVVLSDEPLEMERLKQAASSSFQRAGGDLRRMPGLDVPGEQFPRLLLKP